MLRFKHPSVRSKKFSISWHLLENRKGAGSLSRILLKSLRIELKLCPARAARVPFAQWNSKNRFGKRRALRQEPSEETLKMQASRVDTVMLIRIHFGRIGTSSRRRLKWTRRLKNAVWRRWSVATLTCS